MTPWLSIVGRGGNALDGAADLWRDSRAGAVAAAVKSLAADDPS